MTTTSRIAAALLAAGVGLATGCGTREPTRVAVTGTVNFHGKPVPAGMVLFVSDADPALSGSGPIRPDGTFEATGVPVGPVKVAVQTSMYRTQSGTPKAVALTAPHATATKGVKPVVLPAKFDNPATSGQSATIHRGDNTVSLSLE